MTINDIHQINLPLVNYTNVLTSAANETYISQTDLPNSLAFMIKNKIIIQFDIQADSEKSDEEKSSYTNNFINY